MEEIVLQYHDNFQYNIGNFIKPDGTFLSFNIVHEEFAKSYCLGNSYKQLINLIEKDDKEFKKVLETYCILFNRDASYKEYITSSLSDEELFLYKKWRNINCTDNSGFLVQVLGWDKISSLSSKTISSSSIKPHIRFFNYYLMDWEIISLDKMNYNDNSKSFIINSTDDFSLLMNDDIQYEEEIIEIKKNVKKLELRKNYFK